CQLILIFHQSYIPYVEWEVEYTDEFEKWWESLDEDEQETIAAGVILLEARGPMLNFPFSSGIAQSKHSHMRELRYSIADVHIECSMHSIRGVWPFCSLVAIRQATTVGMISMSPWPTRFTTSTLRLWR